MPSSQELYSLTTFKKKVLVFLLIPLHFQSAILLLVVSVDVVSVFPVFFPGGKTVSTLFMEIFMI